MLRALCIAALLGLLATACSSAVESGSPATSATSTGIVADATTSSTPTSSTTSTATPQPEPAPTTAPTAPDAGFTTPDGRFTYKAVESGRDDDDVETGRTILVDSGDGFGPAFNDQRDRFDNVGEIIFGPDRLIAWTPSGNLSMLFVGRIDATGMIVDSHQLVMDDNVGKPVWFDEAGLLHAKVRDDSVAHDTNVDPFFVMSADPIPLIESDDPLVAEIESEGFWARYNPGYWYRGKTLGVNPACGSSTLYKDDDDGYARVLEAGIELDTVVAIDAGEAFADGGIDSVGLSRVVVLSTECPGEYEGRRLFWGLESIGYGDGGPRFESPLRVVPVEAETVADVLAVLPEITTDGGCCPQLTQLLVEVEQLDGTVATIEIPTG